MYSIIESSIEHANKIIGDFLNYSRNIKLELSETNPKSALLDALSTLEVPNSIIVIDSTQSAPLFRADVGSLKRVFVNLMKNAIDAMPEKGSTRGKKPAD